MQVLQDLREKLDQATAVVDILKTDLSKALAESAALREEVVRLNRQLRALHEARLPKDWEPVPGYNVEFSVSWYEDGIHIYLPDDVCLFQWKGEGRAPSVWDMLD